MVSPFDEEEGDGEEAPAEPTEPFEWPRPDPSDKFADEEEEFDET